MRFQTATFAAAKADALQQLMLGRAVSKDGVVTDFEEYYKYVRADIKRHLNQHLQMECDTMVMRMHEHAEWQRFKAEAEVWPNLKWMPTTSIEQDQVHRQYWSLPLVLPVHHPKWHKHRPGDHWGCKCMLEQTDEEATKESDIPELSYMPSLGLERLPHADRNRLIGINHPYYAKGNDGLPNRIYNCVVTRQGIRPRQSIPPSTGWNESDDMLYYDTPEGIRVSKWADASEIEENLRTATALRQGNPQTDITIQEHFFIYKRPNPEFLIDGGLADAKRITSENGVTAGFKAAISDQRCSRIVIDLDEHFSEKRVKFGVLASKIHGRCRDFEEGIITHCYVVYRGDSVVITEADIAGGKDKIERRLEILRARQ